MLEILYRDQHLVAIHKPAGLLVHRSNIDRHETRFAVQLLRDQIGQRVYPAHRLDKGTSGVLLFALDSETARALGQQFANNEVDKTYLAVVRGWPPESGLIDHPLSRQFDDHGRPQTDAGSPAPRAEPRAEPRSEPRIQSLSALPAQTAFRRLATVELNEAVDHSSRYPTTRYALLELRPRTGRQHQLRRHLKHIAHPIVGDATYGKGVHNRFFQQRFDCHRLLLACTRLRFTHPLTGLPLPISAPLEGEFSSLLQRFDWTQAAGECG